MSESNTSNTKKLSPGCLVKTRQRTPYTFFGHKRYQSSDPSNPARSGLYAPMKLSTFGDMTSIEVPEGTCMMLLSVTTIKKDIPETSRYFTAQAKALLDDQVVHVHIPYSGKSAIDTFKKAYEYLYDIFDVIN
jgi:hypothetical protein